MAEAAIQVPASWERVLTTMPHPIAAKYHLCKSHIRCIIKGNQAGATHTAMHDCCMRLLGMHPNLDRNRLVKPIRCVSKTLPKGAGDEENQQYVEFRRLFPPELIVKDVTARSATMVLRDPNGGSNRKLEFMSSSQEIDAFMSVQRSAYYQDEEIDRLKWDENLMRLIRYNGDVTIGLTPVRGLDWTYDDIWKRAEVIHRSKTICGKFGFPREERFNIKSGIEVFCWATDDNPVMTQEAVDRIFSGLVDEDELAMRRYGVFRQASGRIYKLFDRQVHSLDAGKYFNPSEFMQYWQYRMIDFHPRKPWYVSYVSISPQHEWFVWNELKAQHHHKTTYELREDIKRSSLVPEDDVNNRMSLIDPLSKVKQANTGHSVFDDLTLGEGGLRRCQAADTKNERGRFEINRRLKNALIAGAPNNNYKRDLEPDPRFGQYMPTLWVMNDCEGHVEHFTHFRYKDYKDPHLKATRDAPRPDSHEDKYSDYCRNLEFLGAENPVYFNFPDMESNSASRYFQGQRRM